MAVGVGIGAELKIRLSPGLLDSELEMMGESSGADPKKYDNNSLLEHINSLPLDQCGKELTPLQGLLPHISIKSNKFQ